MGRITIDGKTFDVPDGSNIRIANNSVIVNQTTIAAGLSGIVKIVWEGPAASISCNGDMECGEINGNLTVAGNVTCENVGGNISADGNVVALRVNGSIKAGGNVAIGKP